MRLMRCSIILVICTVFFILSPVYLFAGIVFPKKVNFGGRIVIGASVTFPANVDFNFTLPDTPPLFLVKNVGQGPEDVIIIDFLEIDDFQRWLPKGIKPNEVFDFEGKPRTIILVRETDFAYKIADFVTHEKFPYVTFLTRKREIYEDHRFAMSLNRDCMMDFWGYSEVNSLFAGGIGGYYRNDSEEMPKLSAYYWGGFLGENRELPESKINAYLRFLWVRSKTKDGPTEKRNFSCTFQEEHYMAQIGLDIPFSSRFTLGMQGIGDYVKSLYTGSLIAFKGDFHSYCYGAGIALKTALAKENPKKSSSSLILGVNGLGFTRSPYTREKRSYDSCTSVDISSILGVGYKTPDASHLFCSADFSWSWSFFRKNFLPDESYRVIDVFLVEDKDFLQAHLSVGYRWSNKWNLEIHGRGAWSPNSWSAGGEVELSYSF